MRKQPTLIELIQKEVRQELKKIKRQKQKFKLKVTLTLILPALIVILAVKVIQVYTRIRLKAILTPAVSRKPPVPKPVSSRVSKPDFITPQPVPAPVASEPVPMDPVQEIIITEITEDV